MSDWDWTHLLWKREKMYKDIAGNGWKAQYAESTRTLMSFIRNIVVQDNHIVYFVEKGFLYRFINNKIYRFDRFFDRIGVKCEWIGIPEFRFDAIIQPVFNVVLDSETKTEEKPIIDFTKNLETTSGLPARLLINDFWESRQEYNFLCLIKDPAASHDLIRSFNKFGECGVQSNLRLRNCPKKISIERFVNIHRNGSTYFYETQDLAFANKSKDYIATAVPITINTIEGFDPRNIA